MYLKNDGFTYYKGSEQHRSKGEFLILYGDSYKDIRACVRRVALSQLGHWMMGRANIYGQWVTLSGAYGSDGLIGDSRKLPDGAFDALVRLPDDIMHAMATDTTGWNNAGASGKLVRQWALDNMEALKNAGRKATRRAR